VRKRDRMNRIYGMVGSGEGSTMDPVHPVHPVQTAGAFILCVAGDGCRVRRRPAVLKVSHGALLRGWVFATSKELPNQAP